MSVRPCLLLLLLVSLGTVVGKRAGAEDEPQVPRPPTTEQVVIASVATDPAGEASQLARQALLAREAGDERGTADAFLRLAETHPDVLLSTALIGDPRRFGSAGALRWPAWKIANHVLARMSAAERARVVERWAPLVNELRARARRPGQLRPSLELLATRYGLTPGGGEALLVLARWALERDAPTRAATYLRNWLAFQPDAPPEERAVVVMRLADILILLEDAGGLEELGVLEQSVRSVPVQIDGKETTLADRIAAARRQQKRAASTEGEPGGAAPDESGASESVPAEGPLLTEDGLTLLWSRSLEDPGFLRHLGYWPTPVVQAGAWGRGDTLVLHEGRTVRRLDLLTGRERWRFPEAPLVTILDPRERYLGFDLPWRSVTPAGDAVLVVLGDPSATGRYTFLEQEYEAERIGRECRLRLASLDLATGALQWFTGTVNDTHPILGDGATGCASPPLVVGDEIYCLFARRRGATTFYCACLDRRTGAARWVAPLASGESGRLDDPSRTRDRFTSPYVQSVPWGARPSRAGDEICVVPHAGFAAGVRVSDGTVRWVRALPRYGFDAREVPVSEGQSGRNVPLAWGDAWLLAPMDGPRLLCLTRGSGELRWQRGEAGAGSPPAWRDLLSVARLADGHARLRLSGWQPLFMDPADGALEAPADLLDWDLNSGDPGGRALDLGAYVARASGGRLEAQPWETSSPRLPSVPLPQPEAPDAGDLLRIGDVWVVIGTDRVAALAAPEVIEAADVQAGGPCAYGLEALVRGDAARFSEALTRATALYPGALRRNTFETLQQQMLRLLEEVRGVSSEGATLEQLTSRVEALPAALRGPLYRALALRDLALDKDAEAAVLLQRWLDSADDTLLPVLLARTEDGRLVPRSQVRGEGTRALVRGDLQAAELLRAHAQRPAIQAAWKAREARFRPLLESLLSNAGEAGDREALHRMLRAATGTHAADEARRRLAVQLAAAGRPAEAAALVADRRLDPPWDEGQAEEAVRLERVGRLQLEEAGMLADAGEGERARTLVADLERWAPESVVDAQGRTPQQVADALRARFGWYPARDGSSADVEVWPEGQAPVERDKVRSVEFLGLEGPGAAAVGAAYALVVRGITIEVWSLGTGRRTAVLHGGDEGWFGGSLTSIERWVPGGGILVSSVVAGEPADGSGVSDGDWVRRWQDREVTDLSTFMQLVAASEPGAEIPVSIWRRGGEVLQSFRTGRRPSAQGRLLRYAPLYVDAAGGVLIPGRTGLSRVDPERGMRTPLWTWKEDGVLRRTDVLGGVAYVTIQRGQQPHVLVAVDPRSGAELWRASVQGRITHVDAVGSAIALHSVAPEMCTLLDRHDGTARASLRCFDHHRREFRRNWDDDRPADHAAGRSYVVQGSDHQHAFVIVNTTRATIEYEDVWGHPARSRLNRFVNPQVAAGAFAAVVRAPGLKLFFPDPLGRAPRHSVLLSPNDLSAQQGNLGSIDDESRIFVRGHRLYVVRLPMQGRKNVNAGIFHVDYRGLEGRDSTDAEANGDIIHLSTQKIWMAGSPRPERYILSVEPHFEGLFVSAASLLGEHIAEHYWIVGRDSDEEGPEDLVNLRLFEGDTREARRHAPVRSGPWLYVPIDGGARRFPVRSMR